MNYGLTTAPVACSPVYLGWGDVEESEAWWFQFVFSSHCSSLLVIDNTLYLSPYTVPLLPVALITD